MSAFPAFPKYNRANSPADPGMDLRDYFAAAAMQGMIASVCDAHARSEAMKEADELRVTLHEYFATSAYRTADAMLKAREK